MKKILAISLAVMMALALIVTPALAGDSDALITGISVVGTAPKLFVGEIATLTATALSSSQDVIKTSSATDIAFAADDTAVLTVGNATVVASATGAVGNASEFVAKTSITAKAIGTTKVGATTNNITNKTGDIRVFAQPTVLVNGNASTGMVNLTSSAVATTTAVITLNGTADTDRAFKATLYSNANTAGVLATNFNVTAYPSGADAYTAMSGNAAVAFATNTSTKNSQLRVDIPANAEGVVRVTIEHAALATDITLAKSGLIQELWLNISKTTGLVKYTKLTIDKTDLKTVVGKSSSMTLAFDGEPTNADESVYWTSSDPSVVSFSSNAVNGTSTARKATAYAYGVGTATITLRNLDGSAMDTFTVTVLTKVAPTAVEITNDLTVSAQNGELELTADVYPVNAKQDVVWSPVVPTGWVASAPDADGVITYTHTTYTAWTLTSDGVLTSTSGGTAIPGKIIIVQASTVDTDYALKTKTATIAVSDYVTTGYVSVTAELTEVLVDGTLALTATAWKDDTKKDKATNQSFTWTSSNSAVAKVSDKGVVTGVKAGNVTITATSKENGKSNTINLKVVDNLSTEIWRVKATTLKIRARADSNSPQIGEFKKGDIVNYVSESGAWATITLDSGATAYVARASIEKAPTYAVASFTLNVRSAKGAGDNIVAVAECADTMIVLDDANGWAKVIYNNALSYVSSAHIKLAPLTAKITSNTLSVRAEASSTSAEVGKLTKSDTITITGKTTLVVGGKNVNWYKINYGGTTAFVSSSFVAIN